jgi:two-component system, response regulator, stage 0 sporulation protein F
MAVLVVDDDATVVNLVTAVLHRAGIEAEVALDGPSALLRLGRGRYRAVLSDMTMPGMSGLQLLREARARGHELPFLIMTAYLMPEAEQQLRAEAGVAGVLRKPFDIKRLVEEVRALLSSAGEPQVAPEAAVATLCSTTVVVESSAPVWVELNTPVEIVDAPLAVPVAEIAGSGDSSCGSALLPLSLMEWVDFRLRRQALIAQAERRAAALLERPAPPRRAVVRPQERPEPRVREAELGC